MTVSLETTWTRRSKRVASFTLLLSVLATLLVQSPAFAAPGFELPFACNSSGWSYDTYDYYQSGSTTWRHDNKIDLNLAGNADAGVTVIPAAAGTITSVDSAVGTVVVDHGGGWVTKYLHMVVTPGLTAGQAAKLGTALGKVGKNGKSYGEHLHYGAYLDGNPQAVVLHGTTLRFGGRSDSPPFYGERTGTTTLKSYNNCPTTTHSHNGEMVRDKDTGRVVLVKSGKAFHVPSGGDYNALKANGIPVHEVSHADAMRIPDSGQQATVHTVDDPAIHDPWGYVTRKVDGHGHAGDRYVTWTTHPGGTRYNRFTWELRQAPGRHKIKVFVPHREANADTYYRIYDNGAEVARVRVQQVNIYGWKNIYTGNFGSTKIRIVLNDNEATARNQQLGVDAAQVVPIG